ncbi:MAG: hypothetical protein Q7T78_06535 [Rhodoferax sp.]|nr:hypothetical protein [Rhodoferax sp.]
MTDPKISLNKLGEYLTASPARRRRIVEDQINPKPFIAARYNDAREYIVRYISGEATEQDLTNKSQELRSKVYESDFTTQDKNLSADAIDDFLEIADLTSTDKYKLEKVNATKQSLLNISGVSISVRPDIYIKNDNNETVGAIKLHFPKSNPLNTPAGEYVATGLRVFLEEQGDSKLIDHKLCSVIDIPSGNMISAPKASKKRMQDIAAGCEEIDARWKLKKI